MIIGKNIETNLNVKVNLEKFIDSRGVITASSGGGKSWAIRKFLEESHGKIQQIILDWEGEYANLREKFDYLLVGKSGEIPINIRTAEILAKKLMELKVSTIIDLSDLPRHERILFVKRFLDSLLNLPKELYDHLVMLIIDEAHQICPQKGNAESMNSVIDAMSLGRKRGIGTLLCTQRIAKLNKDAVAEARNGGYGGMGLLEDRKRACEELGFNTKDLEQSIKNLQAGEIYMFGSAISKEVIKVKIGDIKVKPPKISEKGLGVVSKTPENIKKLLKEIIDLPKEAEIELKNKEDMLREITNLRRELTLTKKEIQSPKIEKVIDTKQIELATIKGWRDCEIKYKEIIKSLKQGISFLTKENENLIILMKKVGQNITSLLNIQPTPRLEYEIPEMPKLNFESIKFQPLIKQINQIKSEAKPELHIEKQQSVTTLTDNFGNELSLNLCARKIYSFLYANPQRAFSKIQIAIMTRYSIRSSGFINALSQLNVENLIKKEGNKLIIGIIDESLATERIEEFNKELILRQINKCPREIMEVLLKNPYDELFKEEIAERTRTNYSIKSSGFINAISMLNSLEMIQKLGNKIKLNPEILEI